MQHLHVSLKQTYVGAVLVLPCIFAVACASNQTTRDTAERTADVETATTADFPATDAKAVWDYLEAQNFESWPLWPGTLEYYESKSKAHGMLLTTRVNPVAMNAIRSGGAQDLPEHSIVVKENYSQQKELAAHTVMYKVNGYNSSAGDWFWMKVNPDGTITDSGKVQGCIDCHSKAKSGYAFTLSQ